ncbi:MAG: hypothetical protein WDZ76_06875 [Pseudohongiellaceae bacterium]
MAEENEAGETDRKDKNESRKMLVVLIVLLLLLAIAALLIVPAVGNIMATHFSPGLGLRDGAVISFFVTVVLMIVFAVAAGDGLLGEIQFMIGGFLTFFFIFWLLIAWLF